MSILDPTGQLAATTPEPLSGLIAPEQPENVTEFPQPELERTARIVAKGDKRAIAMLFETRLDGPRVNLLLAKLYVAAENAEREVMKLGDKTVESLLKDYVESKAGVRGS